MLKNINPKSIKIALGGFALLALFDAWLYLRVYKSPAVSDFVAAATSQKPDTFTELYFENDSNLPKVIKDGNLYNFTFTIYDLEGRDMEYPYTVYIKRGNITAVLDHGVLDLKNGEVKTIDETMGPLSLVRKEIVVELTNKEQSINFWMDTQ